MGQKHLLRGQIFKVLASLPALLCIASALNMQSSRAPSMLDRYVRLPGRRCDVRSKAYPPSLARDLDCRYSADLGFLTL